MATKKTPCLPTRWLNGCANYVKRRADDLHVLIRAELDTNNAAVTAAEDQARAAGIKTVTTMTTRKTAVVKVPVLPISSPIASPSKEEVAKAMARKREEEMAKAAATPVKPPRIEGPLPPDERAAYERNLALWLAPAAGRASGVARPSHRTHPRGNRKGLRQPRPEPERRSARGVRVALPAGTPPVGTRDPGKSQGGTRSAAARDHGSSQTRISCDFPRGTSRHTKAGLNFGANRHRGGIALPNEIDRLALPCIGRLDKVCVRACLKSKSCGGFAVWQAWRCRHENVNPTPAT